jgi:hypothetical protein
MKIKLGNWKVDSSTFFRVEWRKPFPKIILHEKFEKGVKWMLRILTLVGIGTSIISLPPLYSLLLSIGLVALEQLLERIIFEYTVFIIQPFPDFNIDYNQWLTNGYLFPNLKYKDQYELYNHFGPAYKTKDYAIKFFSYLKNWNQGEDDDVENNICLSFVIEPDNSYTTYLYANPNRKWLDPLFNKYHEKMKYEKYGKNQQSLVMDMIYWKNLKLVDTSLFPHFLKSQPTSGKFYFVPFYIDDKEHPISVEEMKICKYQYQVKSRNELTPSDVEYHHR